MNSQMDVSSASTYTSSPLRKSLSYAVQDDIALVCFDLVHEKVNKLSMDILGEFKSLFNNIQEDPDIKGIVFYSGKKGSFIAGVDINIFTKISSEHQGEELSLTAQNFANYLEDFPLPILCAIDGVCLGGGLEFVLACDYRVASDSTKTQLGLPEVRLGILPAMGGCVRLPKLIGLQQALNIILPGSTVSSHKAFKIGLVDDVVPCEFLVEKACNFIRAKKFKKPPKLSLRTSSVIAKVVSAPRGNLTTSILSTILERNPLGRKLLFNLARKNVLKETKGQYPAPLRALSVIEQSVKLNPDDAFKLEARAFGELAITPVSHHLVGLFFLNEDMKKDRGVFSGDVAPREVENLGVVGAGAMGGGIAQLAAYNKIPVVLKDIQDQSILLGLSSAKKIFKKALEKRKLTKYEFENQWALIRPALNYSGFKRLGFIIEAVVEELQIKQKVFSELEGVTQANAILATNTSSISIDDISAHLKHPERVVGMHFFNPVYKMPLVEVIRGQKTSDEVVATTVAFAKTLGKTPIVVKNSPGFLVNRILMPYLNEAAFLLEEGNSIENIDRAALLFGLPMGPFTLLDEVGIDVVIRASHVIGDYFKERVTRAPLLDEIYQAGRYGKKTKKGFYNYDSRGMRHGVYEKMKKYAKEQKFLSVEDILKRLIYLMINEAAFCLEERVVNHPRYVDVGMIFGTGFPPFRGGLLRFADQEGLGLIIESLDKWRAASKQPRFMVSRYLREKSSRGEKFYEV